MSVRALRTIAAASLLAASAGLAAAADPYIAAIYVNAPGGADQGSESLVIGGTPGQSLNNYFFVILEGDTNNGGTVDAVINLSAFTLGSNGLLAIRDTATVLNPPPAPGTAVVVRDFNPDIENGGNTYILVRGPISLSVGTVLDAAHDGTLDAPFPGTVVDAVSYVDGDAGGLDYADDVGGIDYGQSPFFTPDAAYRIADPDGNPTFFVIGDVVGTPPGPVSWTSSENAGWSLIGENPDAHVLEIGIPSFRVPEFVTTSLIRGDITINGLPTHLGGMTVERSKNASGQPSYLGDVEFNGYILENLLGTPAYWWIDPLIKYHPTGALEPVEIFGAAGATASITIDLGVYGTLTDTARTIRAAGNSLMMRHTFSGALTLPTFGEVSYPIEKRDMQFTYNPGGTGSGTATLAATVDGSEVLVPVTYSITYTTPTPISSPLSMTGSAAITQYDELTGEFAGAAVRASAAAPCPADLNQDGIVDFSDYLQFLNFYDAGDPTVDFNMDGIVDFSDYLEFLNLYDAGC